MFPLLSRSAKAVQVFADSRSLRLLITDRQAVFVPVIRKEAESTEAVSKESEICSIISERSLRAGRHNNNGTYFRFFT